MKSLIFIILLIYAQSSYSQWEKTEWQSEPYMFQIHTFGDTLFYASSDGGFITTDKGKTWQQIFDRSILPTFESIIISDGNIFLSTLSGVMFSSDLGLNWEFRNNGLSDAAFLKLFKYGDKLFAATSGGGVFISSDSGKNWHSKNNGMEEHLAKYVVSLAINEDKIYAGTMMGIFISTDLGDSWNLINNGLPKYPFASYFVFNKKGEIFVILEDDTEGYNKFYVSKDKGKTWIEKSNNIEDGRYKISFASMNDTIIIGAENNLYLSADFGDTWSKMNNLKDDEWELYSLASFGNELYMCLGGDVFKSTDMGESWINFKPKEYKYGMANSMTMINNKLIVASDRSRPYLNPPCIYTSTDFGDNWVNTCPNNIYDSPNYVWKTTLLTYKNKIFASTNVGFFQSTDFGSSWEETAQEYYLGVYSIAFMGDTIFAGVDWKGVYLSLDMGKTWVPRNTGLPEKSDVYSIKILGSYLFANVENNGIYFSSDKGMTWNPCNNGIPENSLILSFTVNGNNLFAGIANKGIYISTNMGESWEPRNNGLPSKPFVKVFHNVGNTIFAGLHSNMGVSGGIYISNDNGENWINKSDGIFNDHFSSFADNGEYIFAATNHGSTGIYGDAIYRAKLSDFGVINSVDTQTETQNYLYAYPPYPLPATNEVRSLIYWDISTDIENDEMTVYNIYGKKVAGKEKLRIDKLTNYSGNLVWDCSDVPSGIYLININHGTESIAVKVLVNK